MKRSDTLPSTTDRRKAEASTATFMSCCPDCRGWCLTKPLTAATCTAGACVKGHTPFIVTNCRCRAWHACCSICGSDCVILAAYTLPIQPHVGGNLRQCTREWRPCDHALKQIQAL